MKSLDEFEINKSGGFFKTLNRNNKEIKEDRAIAIAESAQMMYQRSIQDMRLYLKQLERDRASMLDLSPSDRNSLVVASDFKSEDFVKKDIEIGLTIRNLSIKLDIAISRYNELFGDTDATDSTDGKGENNG